jgi:hypothetical protein
MSVGDLQAQTIYYRIVDDEALAMACALLRLAEKRAGGAAMTSFYDHHVLLRLIGRAWVEACFGNALAMAVVEPGTEVVGFEAPAGNALRRCHPKQEISK